MRQGKWEKVYGYLSLYAGCKTWAEASEYHQKIKDELPKHVPDSAMPEANLAHAVNGALGRMGGRVNKEAALALMHVIRREAAVRRVSAVRQTYRAKLARREYQQKIQRIVREALRAVLQEMS